MTRIQQIFIVALLVLLQATMAGTARAETSAPVAVFPLQDMSHGRNGINIPFTKYLAERLAASGTKICRQEAVIAFMSNNRIRVAGQLETYHINRLREELGAAFVLLGTVIQKEDKPAPALGLILNLVQTSTGRTIWSYVGAVSAADHPKLLGLGEAKTARQLEPILGDDIMRSWPGESLKQQQKKSTSVDSIVLTPREVVPGAVLHCRVRLRNRWLENRAPRVFLQADDQIYAAAWNQASNTYEASWIAGQTDGRFPVTLIVEWPLYGRTETVSLGYYLVDDVQPLIALDLKDEGMEGDLPIFRDKVVIVPRQIIRKPIARWQISFSTDDDVVIAEQKEKGDLPAMIIWRGQTGMGSMLTEGDFTVRLEVWDEAGNNASDSKKFELKKTPPVVMVAAAKEGQQVKLDMKMQGYGKHADKKIPIAFWRLEMWSNKGKLLENTEGKDLPAQVDMLLPSAEDGQDIQGTLVVRDVLGNTAYKKLGNLLQSDAEKKKKASEEKSTTKAWVEEF